MRFLKDMLLRVSRQVLTAGKANEPVADLGGPLPGHSPFTGHLLEALDGKAALDDGIITGNGVMAYVYQAVARDGTSHQTPHYGYLNGDGDLIFSAPILSRARQTAAEAAKDEDVLVPVPVMQSEEAQQVKPRNVIEQTKEYLSEDRHKIKLHEAIAGEVRKTILQTPEDVFAAKGVGWSDDEFRRRVSKYNEITADLLGVEALLGYWATDANRPLVTLAPRRLVDRIGQSETSGLSAWLSLRWYPIFLLFCSAGIAAVAAGRYENLRELFEVRVSVRHREEESLMEAVTIPMRDMWEAFKLLPDHERHYAPRSEYLHKLLQPMFDDLFFLGSDYDTAFDRFEILYAFSYAYRKGRPWGPPGRFGWRTGSVQQMLTEAERGGDSWPPLKAGFFDGSRSRFNETAQAMQDEFIGKLGWH